MSDTCGSCDAAIMWVLTERGKRMPVDVPGGNRLLLFLPGDPHTAVNWETVPRGVAPLAVSLPSYTSHFATCPDAERHRKPKTSGERLFPERP